MATSGSKSVKVTSYDTLKFSWERTSYSVANNTSTISWKLELVAGTYGAIISSASKSWSVTVDGEKKSGSNSVAISNNSTKTLASGSKVIKHNADGSKVFAFSFSQDFNITFSGAKITTKSDSGTGTITDIPRAATIKSAPNFNDEENPKITYNNPAGTSVTTLQACISFTGDRADIAYRDISKTDTEYTFNLTDAERQKLWSRVTSGSTNTVVFIIKTVLGGVTYTDTAKKTLTLINHKPTVSGTVRNIYDYTAQMLDDNQQKMIARHNEIEYSATAQAAKGATIKKIVCVNGGIEYTGATGVITNAEVGSFKFIATDSRGNTAEFAATPLEVIDYKHLTVGLKKCNAEIKDNTIQISFTATGTCHYGALGSINNMLYVSAGLYLVEDDGLTEVSGTYTEVEIKEDNTFTFSSTISADDYEQKYVLRIMAQDVLETSRIDSKKLLVKPVFDWGENDFSFNVPVKAASNKYMTNGSGYGLDMDNSDIIGCNSIYFRDESATAAEAIKFYRDGTNYDCLYAAGGSLYFTPNYPEETVVYNISGLFKAMTTSYELSATATAGTGYTIDSVSAYLTGNTLRMYIKATRSPNATAGDMTNEKVATVKVNHSGKIAGMNNISFCSGTNGAVATFNTTNISNGDTVLQFDIDLCAAAAAENVWGSYFAVPVRINPDKY